jgi:hypothetical protein
MSARKLPANSTSGKRDKAESHTRIDLPPESVLFRKNGIEFKSEVPFPTWTEMTVTLHSRKDSSQLDCTGIVVACSGNRHLGYHVSLLFSGLTTESQAWMESMAAAMPS